MSVNNATIPVASVSIYNQADFSAIITAHKSNKLFGWFLYTHKGSDSLKNELPSSGSGGVYDFMSVVLEFILNPHALQF